MKEYRIAKEVYESSTQGRYKVGQPRIRWDKKVRQVAEARGINWYEIGALTPRQENMEK